MSENSERPTSLPEFPTHDDTPEHGLPPLDEPPEDDQSTKIFKRTEDPDLGTAERNTSDNEMLKQVKARLEHEKRRDE